MTPDNNQAPAAQDQSSVPAAAPAEEAQSEQAAPQTAAPVTSVVGQVVQAINSASSIVVTTNKKPTIDQISTVIGLSHMLQALNKHAVAVVSTTLPKAVEFLNPNTVIEADTKRLQDFVISLNKDKADKLRYKVEDDEVRIFITPYKTVITEKDFNFTSGDYNIDTVLAVGVMERTEIDDAMLASPRILGDAKDIITFNAGPVSKFGSINWSEPDAVSVAELAITLSNELGGNVLQGTAAQAFLTSLVEVTEQFGNNHTTPRIMTMAGQLMTAGADQQVIVKNLREAKAPVPAPAPTAAPKAEEKLPEQPKVEESPKEEAAPKIEQTAPELPKPEVHVKPIREGADEPKISETAPTPAITPIHKTGGSRITTNPGVKTLNKPDESAKEEAEKDAVQKELDEARDAVNNAATAAEPAKPQPIQSLNAQTVDDDTNEGDIIITHDGELKNQQ